MKYWNIIQIKQNLPEVLQRIADCKKIADAQLFLYQCLVKQCVYETTHPDVDNGIWTTAEFMTEVWNNYKRNLEEAKFLQERVDSLKNNFGVRNT